MSRCRCCDSVLSDRELRARNKITGQPEDFCYPCRAAVAGIPSDSTEDIELMDILGISIDYLSDGVE